MSSTSAITTTHKDGQPQLRCGAAVRWRNTPCRTLLVDHQAIRCSCGALHTLPDLIASTAQHDRQALDDLVHRVRGAFWQQLTDRVAADTRRRRRWPSVEHLQLPAWILNRLPLIEEEYFRPAFLQYGPKCGMWVLFEVDPVRIRHPATMDRFDTFDQIDATRRVLARRLNLPAYRLTLPQHVFEWHMIQEWRTTWSVQDLTTPASIWSRGEHWLDRGEPELVSGWGMSRLQRRPALPLDRGYFEFIIRSAV